jgi:hypothetical protein
MTQTVQTPPYTVETDEKVVVVVVYTPNLLFRGELVVKKLIRVNTWLRTNTTPDRITLYNAKALVTSAGTGAKPTYFTELHIATHQIEAFHLLPPASEPIDYDPTEPNRRMQQVTVLLDSFRIDGSLRMSMQANLTKFLDTVRETFTPVYDAQVTNAQVPSIGTLSVPYLLVRQESCVFTLP